MPARALRPVFVVGCHRSGTNLLYDTLLSAGGFAVYRGYLPIYKVLIPRCGPLSDPSNRAQAIALFLRSKGFRRSNLDAADLSVKLQLHAHTGGDFMRIVMEEVMRAQNAARWAVYDPDYVLHMPRIKKDLPDALFLHIVRDGRDIALSLSKMEGFRPFPWSRQARGLLETAVYWQWVVQKGRSYGQLFPDSYMEIHYEQLVQEPEQTLAQVSKFIDQDLDYEQIRRASMGRVGESNSSFLAEPDSSARNPVNRWKERLSRAQIAKVEALVGGCLQNLGYPLATDASDRTLSLQQRLMRAFYPGFLDAKFWAKIHTPVGRFANLSVLELDNQPSIG